MFFTILTRARAPHLFFSVFDHRSLADIDPDAGVKFQRITARRSLRIPVNHADLIAKLVDENTNGSRLADIGRQFTQSLRHQSRLQPHFRFAHLAFDFGLRRQRGDRVDHHDIDGARTDQVVGDLQRLLPVVGLRNQQVVDIHAELLRIRAVESMFRVDKCGDSARFLGLGDRVDSQRGFTRRFGAENLDNTSFRIPADPERMVDRYRPGRDDRDFVDRPSLIFMMAPFPKSFSILSITALNTLSFSGFT